MAPGMMGRWSPKRSVAANQLIAESEAYLAGDLAELYQHRDGYVPVWAWTNLLAHGDEARLRRAYQAEQDRNIGVEQRWLAARSYVAGEVLALADQEGSLRLVQQQVLIDVELDLSMRSLVDDWSPEGWVGTVMAALDNHRRVRRH